MLHADPDQPLQCAGIREVEAESVAHLVMAAHGVDTAPYTFPYVATWAQPVATADNSALTDVIASTGSRVIQTAHTILEAVPVTAAEDPAGAAITVRVSAATAPIAELQDRARAAALPPVNRATLLGVIADSHDFYRRRVATSWVPDYLTSRHLTPAIDSHGLGYAPGGWTVLTDHLRSLGYRDTHIEAAGMATRARTGNLIDRFRDRLTIPLLDPDGDLVGFTARRAPHVDDPRVPRYLNTATTSLFSKHDLLYGLNEHHHQLAAGGVVPVICEGPLDAIALDLLPQNQDRHVAGVAAIGTAFTDNHARHLRAAHGDQQICLAFDADPAGQTATETAWRKLTDHGPVDVRVAVLPTGEDPASLAASQPTVLLAAVIDAQPAAMVITARQLEQLHIDGHAARELAAFRSLSRLVDRIPVEQRPAYLLDLAQRLHIEPADAATLTAEQNPHIVMDRITARARQLDHLISTTQNHHVDDQPLASRPDHRARPITSR